MISLETYTGPFYLMGYAIAIAVVTYLVLAHTKSARRRRLIQSLEIARVLLKEPLRLISGMLLMFPGHLVRSTAKTTLDNLEASYASGAYSDTNLVLVIVPVRTGHMIVFLTKKKIEERIEYLKKMVQ